MKKPKSIENIYRATSQCLLFTGALFLVVPSSLASDNQADNTTRNSVDKGHTLTPIDQSNSQSDTKIVASIRDAITDAKELSTNAKNVKVIVINGAATLRGPVNTVAEKEKIASIVKNTAGVTNVDNQLTVKTKED